MPGIETMKVLPTPPSPALPALLRDGPRDAAEAPADELVADAGRTPLDTLAAAPDWRSALLRRRAQDDEATAPAEPVPVASLLVTPTPPPQTPQAPTAVSAVAPSTPTTEKIDALRQLTDAHPAAAAVARSWQVELPASAAGPAWQLHIQQAQPLAPLNLELRVPPAAQSQARQQLSDLDKRLREAGHDVLRPRVSQARDSKRSAPPDEVTP